MGEAMAREAERGVGGGYRGWCASQVRVGEKTVLRAIGAAAAEAALEAGGAASSKTEL